jgi:hypothetical protein
MYVGNCGLGIPLTAPPAVRCSTTWARPFDPPSPQMQSCCILPQGDGRDATDPPSYDKCFRSSRTSTSARPHHTPRLVLVRLSDENQEQRRRKWTQTGPARVSRASSAASGRGLWRKINDMSVTAKIIAWRARPRFGFRTFWSSGSGHGGIGRSQTLRTNSPSSLAGTGRTDCVGKGHLRAATWQ